MSLARAGGLRGMWLGIKAYAARQVVWNGAFFACLALANQAVVDTSPAQNGERLRSYDDQQPARCRQDTCAYLCERTVERAARAHDCTWGGAKWICTLSDLVNSRIWAIARVYNQLCLVQSRI